MQLSVIIVNYNVKYFTGQCLYTVINACKNLKAEIIVIDNNSADGSRDFFTGRFTNVHFIWNRQNVGFSKANNIALQQATGRYILFLNPDTLIPEDCFEKCLSFFETAPAIGALGTRMIDGTGTFLKESKRGFPALLPSFFRFSGLAALFPHSKTFAGYYAGHLPDTQNQITDVLAGAFMMVDKKVLDKTGGFDEAFFMYGEDIDLSYRIQQAGYKNYYFADSTIIHFKGASTKKDSLQYVKIFYGAMKVFVHKHYGSFKAGLYGSLVQMVIWKQMAAIQFKKIFLPVFSNQKPSTEKIPALVVGSEERYLSVIEMLKNARSGLQITGRVDTTELLTNGSLGGAKNLPELISRYAIQHIIFCINDLPVKEIISTIQILKPSVRYQFYEEGSRNITGSNNENAGVNLIATD